ncbi:hypothetical protein TNCV_1099211 [Trichonephila clavipes]|nr:hypothetical protein TNCV_1099211 [Trichonephila clavipes]
MPPDWQRPDRGPRNSSWQKGLHVRLSLVVALGSTSMTQQYNYASFRPNFERKPGGGQRPPTSLLLPPTLREDLLPRRLSRVPPCHKGTIHLQTPMPSPGFEPRPYGTGSASPTTIPKGR